MSRNYYDAEMMIWQGSGLSLWQFVRVHSRVILLTVFSIALLSFLLTPWSNQQSTEIRERFAKRSDIARISAGQFIESSKGQRIFFVEAVDPALRFIRHVFVASIVGNTTDITVAQQGHTEFDREGNHFIVLEKGRRYQQVEQTLDARLLEFKRYQFRINEAPPDMTINLSIRAKTTLELIASHDGEARAELARRMGMPIMGLLLAFLAIPLSAVNPRAGRSFHLIAAVLIFVVYTNGLNIMQSLILQNRLSFNWACWALHGVIALLVLALLTWHVEHNHQHHPIRYWLKMKAYWRR